MKWPLLAIAGKKKGALSDGLSGGCVWGTEVQGEAGHLNQNHAVDETIRNLWTVLPSKVPSRSNLQITRWKEKNVDITGLRSKENNWSLGDKTKENQVQKKSPYKIPSATPIAIKTKPRYEGGS